MEKIFWILIMNIYWIKWEEKRFWLWRVLELTKFSEVKNIMMQNNIRLEHSPILYLIKSDREVFIMFQKLGKKKINS